MLKDHHDSILLRDYYGILAPGTVQTVSPVGTAPHLVAITLVSFSGAFLLLVLILHYLRRHRLVEPCGIEKAFSVPHAPLEHELSHLGERLGGEEQAPSSRGIILRGNLPPPVTDAQRLEELMLKIFVQPLSRHPRDDDGQEI